MTRAKNELSRNEDFMKLYSHLENKFAHTRSTSAGGNSAIPKGVIFHLNLCIVYHKLLLYEVKINIHSALKIASL